MQPEDVFLYYKKPSQNAAKQTHLTVEPKHMKTYLTVEPKHNLSVTNCFASPRVSEE